MYPNLHHFGLYVVKNITIYTYMHMFISTTLVIKIFTILTTTKSCNKEKLKWLNCVMARNIAIFLSHQVLFSSVGKILHDLNYTFLYDL